MGTESTTTTTTTLGQNEHAKKHNSKNFNKTNNHIQNETKEIKENFTNNISRELEILKTGKIPQQIIYTGVGKELLDKIDKNNFHIYSTLINDGIFKTFIQNQADIIYYDKKLSKCLANMDTRVDIGTGNGIVSNTIAFSIQSIRNLAQAEQITKTLDNEDEMQKIINNMQLDQKPTFISCDLSKDSLQTAASLANNDFYDLEKIFDLSYTNNNFETILKKHTENTKETNNSQKPQFITMFNMLANFEYNELKEILSKVYNSMGKNNVFMTSFFNADIKTNNNNQPEHQSFIKLQNDAEQYLKENKTGRNYKSAIISKNLYNNPETKERITKSFCKHYNIDTSIVKYNVTAEYDGRNYIKISLTVPKDTIFTIDNIKLKAQDLIKNEKNKSNNNYSYNENTVTFTALKSYRMTEQQIKDVVTEVGFKIEDIRNSDMNLQSILILHK